MEPLGKEPRGILVKLARHYGYCMGVELAIKKALETAAQTGRVWTDGPIIHNKQAVENLREHGIEKLRSDADLRPGDTVLIRAHGVPRRRLLQLEDKTAHCNQKKQQGEKPKHCIESHPRSGLRSPMLGKTLKSRAQDVPNEMGLFQ